MNPEDLRRRNTGLILTSLRREGPATRTELARRTGLAKATIGTIMAPLEDLGLVAESGEVTTGRGRPGRSVELTGPDVMGLGLEVNVDYVSTVTIDVGGLVRHEETVAVGPDESPLAVVQRVAGDRADRIRSAGTLAGVVVAVPGLVAADQRTVRWAPNLDWSELDLAGSLESVTGCSVTVDNDANCAARAEADRGVATGTGSALYLTGTVGIGAGLVVEGQVARGAAGFAGEVGHLPLGDPAAACGCGRLGCWETAVGLRAMLARVGVAESATPWSSALAVADRAETDPHVRDGLTAVGSRLGRGLAALSGVLDPAVIVLGGYFVPLAPWLLPAIEPALDEHLSFAALHRPEVRLSSLGLQAAALGAAEHALTEVFAGRF